ncbi:tetratricopeptide repeat protein [Actinosynnema sp. NPDC049800]
MDFHLHTAFAADHLLDPHRQLVHRAPPVSGVHPLPLPDSATATAWFKGEHTTLLATQLAAAALGRHDIVWHIAWTLHTFHRRRGHWRDALAVWQTALDAADHLPDPATGRTHRHLGHAYARLNLHKEAIGHLYRALELAVRDCDPIDQAYAHEVLAVTWGREGNERQALSHARQSLDLLRTLGRPEWEAYGYNQVARYAARLGDFDTAREHCSAALTLSRHHHNPDSEALTLDTLGFIAHRTGDQEQALDHYRQALTLYRTLGHTFDIADTFDRIGHPHAALGQREQARTMWLEALELYKEQGRDADAERMRRQLDGLAGTRNENF